MTPDPETARHVIQVIIRESIDETKPKQDGALVMVEHSVRLRESNSATPETIKPDPCDLLEVLANLAVATILTSEQTNDEKLHAAVTLVREVMMTVTKGLKPHKDLVDSFKGTLTDEQQAALDLSVSAPSFKTPIS